MLLPLFSVGIFLPPFTFSPVLVIHCSFAPTISDLIQQQVDRIVCEEGKGERMHIVVGLKNSLFGRKGGGVGREEWEGGRRRKGRKASQESRVLPPFFPLNSSLQPALEIPSDHHLSLWVADHFHSSNPYIDHLLYHNPNIYPSQCLSSSALWRGFAPCAPWTSCSHPLLCCGSFIRPLWVLLTCRWRWDDVYRQTCLLFRCSRGARRDSSLTTRTVENRAYPEIIS